MGKYGRTWRVVLHGTWPYDNVSREKHVAYETCHALLRQTSRHICDICKCSNVMTEVPPMQQRQIGCTCVLLGRSLLFAAVI